MENLKINYKNKCLSKKGLSIKVKRMKLSPRRRIRKALKACLPFLKVKSKPKSDK